MGNGRSFLAAARNGQTVTTRASIEKDLDLAPAPLVAHARPRPDRPISVPPAGLSYSYLPAADIRTDPASWRAFSPPLPGSLLSLASRSDPVAYRGPLCLSIWRRPTSRAGLVLNLHWLDWS